MLLLNALLLLGLLLGRLLLLLLLAGLGVSGEPAHGALDHVVVLVVVSGALEQNGLARRKGAQHGSGQTQLRHGARGGEHGPRRRGRKDLLGVAKVLG